MDEGSPLHLDGECGKQLPRVIDLLTVRHVIDVADSIAQVVVGRVVSRATSGAPLAVTDDDWRFMIDELFKRIVKQRARRGSEEPPAI